MHLLAQIRRMNAARSAQDRLSKCIAGQRIKIALSKNVPSVADTEVEIGYEVLMYKNKPV